MSELQTSTCGKYQIKIFHDQNFKQGSADNSHQYDFEYFHESDFVCPTIFGIKIYEGDNLLKSAVIGSIGGGTSIHKNSTILESDRLLICCSDSLFCLSIPDLELLWRTQADPATCFQVFKYQDSYIVHGEIEISRLGNDGKIIWQQSGADIFMINDGTESVELTANFIIATDWENRKYKFDYGGRDITDKHNWTKAELDAYDYAFMREQDERGRMSFAIKKAVKVAVIEAEKMAHLEEKENIARKLLKLGLLVNDIVESTGLTLEHVEKLQIEK